MQPEHTTCPRVSIANSISSRSNRNRIKKNMCGSSSVADRISAQITPVQGQRDRYSSQHGASKRGSMRLTPTKDVNCQKRVLSQQCRHDPKAVDDHCQSHEAWSKGSNARRITRRERGGESIDVVPGIYESRSKMMLKPTVQTDQREASETHLVRLGRATHSSE